MPIRGPTSKPRSISEVDDILSGKANCVAPDGVEIHFDAQGNGNPALVFVHGWANNRSIWDDQVAHFSEQYTAVAIDLPGFGASGKNRQYSTMRLFGLDVATVIRHLDLKHVVLVGFSMGAPVVIETAIAVPELIRAVVLVDELHDVEAMPPLAAIDEIASGYLDVVTHPDNGVMVAGGFYKKNQEATFNRLLPMLQDAPGVGWKDCLIDALRWESEDCIGALRQLQVPLTAINSSSQPTNIDSFKKHVPSFQAEIIPDTGHLVMWDAPAEFNRALQDAISRSMEDAG
jgi:pimeloyl-ACP methyl ester carboxylesterase